MDVKITMKIKIFNLKMKKRFFRIAASLLACASLMVSVSIPGQAAKGRVFEKFFGQNYESNTTITNLLKECQNKIQGEIDKNLEADFGQADSVEIGGYTFTKKRYQHIAYGDYQNGVNSQGLHMNCGLDFLNQSYEIFGKKIVEALKNDTNLNILNDEKKKELEANVKSIDDERKQLQNDPIFIKLSDEEKKVKENEALKKYINAYQDLPNKDNNSDKLMHCKLIHSNVSHTSRYLFPSNWGCKELKQALKIATAQKAEFETILDGKYNEIAEKKQEIQSELSKLEELAKKNEQTKKEKSANTASAENKDDKTKNTASAANEDDKTKKEELNDLLKRYVLNNMLYGCEKKQLALKDECFPNVYGYANTNGKSVSLHIIDIGDVENNKEKCGQKILVQLVTDELSKEIVTFFPLNVQNLQKDEFRIVPNEGEDDADDNSNNSPEPDNNLPKTNNNSPKTKIYDIFQLDELNGKQFLRRTKFEISDKSENEKNKPSKKNNKASELDAKILNLLKVARRRINNRNMNVLRNILDKFKSNINDQQSKKYLSELKQKCDELKQKYLDELKTFVDDKQKNDGELDNYIENTKNELESTKKVDTLDESNNDLTKEDKKDKDKKKLIQNLKTEFKNLKPNNDLPQNSGETEKSYDEQELDEAKILMLNTILGNVFDINCQIKTANKQISENKKDIKSKGKDVVSLRSGLDSLRKQLANNVELMQEDIIETLLLKSKDRDECEFTQGGLDLSEEVKNLGSLDKYVSELDQLLNNLLMDNSVCAHVMSLMKIKLDREAAVEKNKEAVKKANEAEKEEVDFSDAGFALFG